MAPEEQQVLGTGQDPAGNPARGESVGAWVGARVAADAQMRAAAARRMAGPAEPAGPGDDASPDVLMVLTREHNQVHTLIQELSALPGHGSGGTPDDLSRRATLVEAISARLSRHEAAEDQVFWPAVREALPDGDALADGAQAQEAAAGQTLTALAGAGPDSDEFDALVQRLTAQVRKHVADEAQVFLRMREAVSDADREKLGLRLIAAKEVTQRPRERDAGTGPGPDRPR